MSEFKRKPFVDVVLQPDFDDKLLAGKLFHALSDLAEKQSGNVSSKEAVDLIEAHPEFEGKIYKHIHPDHAKDAPCKTILCFTDHSSLEMLFSEGYLEHMVAGVWHKLATENFTIPASHESDGKPTIH